MLLLELFEWKPFLTRFIRSSVVAVTLIGARVLLIGATCELLSMTIGGESCCASACTPNDNGDEEGDLGGKIIEVGITIRRALVNRNIEIVDGGESKVVVGDAAAC